MANNPAPFKTITTTKRNQPALTQAPRQRCVQASSSTPLLNHIIAGGSLNDEDMKRLEDEILAGKWIPKLNRRNADELPRLPLYIPVSAPNTNPTPRMPTVHQHLPTEIWLNIWSKLLEPRVLKIEMARDSFPLSLAANTLRIPGPLFMSPAAKTETLKTHKVAFTSLFAQPILFNNQEDVLLFDPASIEFLSESIHRHYLADHSLKVARQSNVRFLAVSDTPNLNSSWTLRYELQLNVSMLIILIFKSIEKVIFVSNMAPKSLRVDQEYRLFGRMLRRLHNTSRLGWERMQNNGKVVSDASRWILPKVVVVNNEAELFAASRGEIGREV